jgi:hypothetical protein
MADNTTKYTTEIDIDTSSSIAELKKLKKELRSIPLDTEEFKVAQARINDIEDSLKGARTGADSFVEVLGQLPGPIGNIGSSVAGTVLSLKTFTSLKFGDLRNSFGELSKDVIDIGKGIGRLTGLTKLYEFTNQALSKSFVALGVSEGVAATGAKALSAALISTGIGALVVAIGYAVSKLIEFAGSTKESDAAAAAFNETIAEQERLLQNDAEALDTAAKAAVTRAKIAGKSEAEIAQIQKNFNKEKLENLRAYDEQLFQQSRELNKNDKLSAEERAKLSDDLNKKILKSGQDITKQILSNSQFELDTQLSAKEKADAKGKALTEKNNSNLKQLIDQRNKDIAAAQKVSVESYIQTLADRDKDVYKRGQELTEDLVLLENGRDAQLAEARRKGIKNTTAIEEAYQANVKMAKESYRVDVQKIEEKYDKEDLDKVAEQQKKVTDFDSKVAEIRISAIKDEVVKSKAERQKKYDDELAELEADKEFIKRSEEEKNEIRKNLKTALENDLAKIDDDAKLKKNEKDIKEIDDELRLLELRSAGMLNGTKAYFEARAAILDAEEAKELAKVDLTEAEKTAIKDKYTKLRAQLDEDEIASTGKVISATLDALGSLTSAIASGYDEEAKTSKEAFEKRKKLQKATALLSAASGIVQILTQPSTLPSPFDWIVKGINAVALGVTTAVQIKNIDKTQFDGGGSSTSSGAPSAAASVPKPTVPTLASAPVPQISGTTGGNNPSSQIAQTIGAASGKPVKAYVVSGDVTSQQALDRRTTRAATFSG